MAVLDGYSEPALPAGKEASSNVMGDGGDNTDPAENECGEFELELEQAVAFGVDGYDPEDPWNAVLYLEGETTVTLLPLTPTHLDALIPQLDEVRDGQRAALGVPAGEADPRLEPEVERPRPLHRMAHAARLATGSEPVARLWRDSIRGKVTLIAAVVLFILAGALLGLLA